MLIRANLPDSSSYGGDDLVDIRSDDFCLDDLLTVDQVVERFPIFHRSELYAAMRARKLRHWPKGRQRFTTERWLQDWIRSQLCGGDGASGQKVPEADTGDRRGWSGPTSRRMTPEEAAVAAKLLAQSIMRKPRKPKPQSR